MSLKSHDIETSDLVTDLYQRSNSPSDTQIISFPQCLYSAFSRIYNEDKAKYGDPADSGHKVVDVRELSNWQVVLLAHAKNVEPTHKRKSPS